MNGPDIKLCADVDVTNEFLKGVNNGTIRAVSNDERLFRFLEMSRDFRRNCGVPRSRWPVANLAAELIDELHTPGVFMDPDTGRFLELPGCVIALGFTRTRESWAP